MKALTLWQPWASLMLCCDDPPKRNETRSWSTRYRGSLAIHAAKREPAWVRRRFLDEPGPLCDLVVEHLAGGRVDDVDEAWRDLPRGAVVGVVSLVDVVRVAHVGSVTPSDYDLGDYSDGRYVWRTRRPLRLADPVPFRGRQGLWDVPRGLLGDDR